MYGISQSYPRFPHPPDYLLRRSVSVFAFDLLVLSAGPLKAAFGLTGALRGITLFSCFGTEARPMNPQGRFESMKLRESHHEKPAQVPPFHPLTTSHSPLYN